eukprot:2304433-Rhodomonas_salina.1
MRIVPGTLPLLCTPCTVAWRLSLACAVSLSPNHACHGPSDRDRHVTLRRQRPGPGAALSP